MGAFRERLIIGTAAATRFGSGILMGTALGYYIGESGGSDLAAALVYTAFYIGMMFFAPVWGAIADVTGRRRAVLVLSGLGATLAILPLTIVGGTYAPVGLRALYASFAAAFPPVMLAVASARGGDSGRGRAVGFYNSARAVGFTGGQLTVGALLGILAPASLYLVIAAVSLVSTLAVALVGQPEPAAVDAAADETRPNDRNLTVSEILSTVRERLFPAVDDREHLHKNGLRWLYVALALRHMSVLGVMSLLPVYLPQSLGFSELWMGALLALNPAGQSVFMLLFGRIADVTGRKRLITFGMAGSAGFSVVVAAATIPSDETLRFAVSVLAFLLIAASFSAMVTGALAFIGDVAPPNRESELMGLRTTAKGVGGVLGPLFVGGLALFVSREVAFVVGSLPGVAATVLVGLTLVETRTARSGVPILGD